MADGHKDFSKPEYSPFHKELDVMQPMEKFLNVATMQQVIRREIDLLTWGSLFRNSPMSNGEAEMIIGMFVTEAACAGQWTDIELQTNRIPKGYFIPLEFAHGMELLIEHGFATKRQDENGQEWLSPTPTLLAFAAERLHKFRNSEE